VARRKPLTEAEMRERREAVEVAWNRAEALGLGDAVWTEPSDGMLSMKAADFMRLLDAVDAVKDLRLALAVLRDPSRMQQGSIDLIAQKLDATKQWGGV
jgi:hypothetical protein